MELPETTAAILREIERRHPELTSTLPRATSTTWSDELEAARAAELAEWTSQIPEEFQPWTLANIPRDKANEAALQAADKYVAELDDLSRVGVNLVLTGPYGTGKTSLAWALGRAISAAPPVGVALQRVESYRAAGVVTAGTLNRVLVASWSEVCESEKVDWKREPKARRLAGLMRAQFIVLDDVGVKKTLDVHGQGWLFDLVDLRYRERRPTFITSNLPMKTGPECPLDPRIVDRLSQADRCLRRELTGPSRRRSA